MNPPPGEVVLCVDEKTGMQALERRFADRPPAPRRARRREFEYKRHGTQSLFCAFDVHTGRVVESCDDRRRAQDLVRFMEKVAAHYPKGKVHIIWDNLNIHYDGPVARWSDFNRRHGDRFILHYTPKHASWVNQVELFFSIFTKAMLARRQLLLSRRASGRSARVHRLLEPRKGPSLPVDFHRLSATIGIEFEKAS